MNKITSRALLAATLLLGFNGTVTAQVLKIYNWKNYIDTGLIEAFERTTDVDIQLSEFTTVEELERALNEHRDYDIVVPSHFQLPELIAGNKLEKLDTSRLPNHSRIDNSLLAALAAFDGADRYAVPYLWTAIGIAYDTQAVNDRMRGEAPQSWSLLFYDKHLERLSSCGISWLEAPAEVFSLKINFLGGKLDHTSERRLRTYSAELNKSARHLREVNNEGYIEGLATGQLCVSMAWAGHALAANQSRKTISFMLPEEGGLLTIDSWAILRDSTNKDTAYQFINFMLEQSSGRRNASATNFFSHLPPSAAASEGTGLDPTDVLGANYRHKLYFVEKLEPSRTRLLETHWQSITSDL